MKIYNLNGCKSIDELSPTIHTEKINIEQDLRGRTQVEGIYQKRVLYVKKVAVMDTIQTTSDGNSVTLRRLL